MCRLGFFGSFRLSPGVKWWYLVDSKFIKILLLFKLLVLGTSGTLFSLMKLNRKFYSTFDSKENRQLVYDEPRHEETGFLHICENKDADQPCSNCTADQRLCLRFTDCTVPLLHTSKI